MLCMMFLIYANHCFADIARSGESGETSSLLLTAFIFSSNVAELQLKNTEKQDYLFYVVLWLSYTNWEEK